MSVASPSRAAFPLSREGRHPRLHFRGLLRLHSNYGPLDRSTAQGGLCHRASVHPVTRTNRLPATRSNRQLSGWILPPLVIRAFWAHRDGSVSTAPGRARGRPASAAPPGSRSPASPARPGLLLLPVLGTDDLRGQRYRPGMTRGNRRGRHHVVVILHGPIAALAPRAVGAGDLPRAEVFGAVERDQKVAVQAPDGTQPTTPLQAFQQRSEERIEPVRRHRIQHRADLVVRRDPRHGEQRLAVRTPPRARKCTLMGQERRALHEDKERTPKARSRPSHSGYCFPSACPAKTRRPNAVPI